MKFTVEKSEIDFGSVQIDNIFIEDYMPIANGDFVKVYLYAFKNMYSQNEFQIDNNRLASNLNLTLTDVERAWDYWEKEGLVVKYEKIEGGYDIKFKDLKKYYVDNLQGSAAEQKSSTGDLVDSMESSSVRTMFNAIDYYMRRQTTPVEKMEILSWITNYNMGPDMIEMCFEYCTEKKKKVSVNYVRAVIISWYDKGLSTLEDVEMEIEKSDKKYIRKNKVLRKLGLQFRAVSEQEITLINSWFDEHKFNEELINEALGRTAQIPQPSINYVNAVLLKWRKMGISSLEDIKTKDIKPEVQKKESKNKFNNFNGQSKEYTAEELNQMAKNMTRRRNQR